MKNVVFIHQNMPGQFKFLAHWFGRQKGMKTFFITQRRDREIPGVQRVEYGLHRTPNAQTHHYLLRSESAVLHGQAVARKLSALRNGGIVPDVIIGHTGWGETLYAKDVFPDTPLLGYCEFYYQTTGSDIGFDPSEPPEIDALLRARTRNAHFLLALEASDKCWSPTQWQRSVHPTAYQPKIEVVHEGVDTSLLKPDAEATVTLPGGRVLTPRDEVVTYVARNLEPYRGFPTFMRALPEILARRPGATVLVVGGEDVSYGAKPKDFESWRAKMEAEVEFDRSRVHFLGSLPYGEYRRVLQVSSAHVYLTYPFVLSWSMLEAMASGCLIVGSRTAPVQEVIEDGVNGVLVDFFSPADVAERVVQALEDPGAFSAMRAAARETVLQRYELQECFRKQKAMIRDLTGSLTP